MTLFRETLAGIEVLRRAGAPGGVPLVLLHGIGSDAETWTRMIEALDPAIEVMAWDAPGYGQSTPLGEASPTPSHYADQLIDVLDMLAWHKVFLAGHSLGTLFAARFAARYPDRVAGLALLSPALGYGVTAGQDLPAHVQARIDDLTLFGIRDFAAKRAPRLVHLPETKPDVLASVQRAMAAVRPDGYAQAVHALGAGTLLMDAGKITVPALVAVGRHDVVTPPDNARALHAALPHPRPLVLVDGAGHALPQENPEIIAQLLTNLLQEVVHG